MTIPFNKPYLTGKEMDYITDASAIGHLSGNGKYTGKCHKFFESRYNIKKCLLTTSCTDALEMAAILIGIKPGDEVIIPSFTFVSTALAFARQGASIRFIDSRPDHPGMNENLVEMLINEKTRAIIPVHYSGIACDMDKIMALAAKYNLYVIEDAAHGIESLYKGKPLGSIGHLGCFSFHETKNIHCGEGGMLAVNDQQFADRAEIIWEKGTNRSQFFRGDALFYEWKDTGSSFLPSELNAAFLLAQLESLNIIQERRIHQWHLYAEGFKNLEKEKIVKIPLIPEYSTLNGNSFFLLCKNKLIRDGLIKNVKRNGIMILSHYLPLHKSQFYCKKHDGRELKMSEIYSDTLVRFPLFHELADTQISEIIKLSIEFITENEAYRKN